MQHVASRTNPLHRADFAGARSGVALGGLWGQRRPRRGFSEARPLGSRHFGNRGCPKWLETNSVGSPRAPRNFEALNTPPDSAAINWGFDRNEALSPETPQVPSGHLREPLHRNLFVPRIPLQPLWIRWVQESPGGHGGEGENPMQAPLSNRRSADR